MWLDSCNQGGELGRYDIIVARPHTTLVTRGEQTEITRDGQVEYSTDDPFALLRRNLMSVATPGEMYFSGGAVGYFSYDLSRRIERLLSRAADDLAMPEMALGIYDWALVCDHHARRCRLVSSAHHPETREQWPQLVELFERAVEQERITSEPFTASGRVEANLSEHAYAASFDKIQHYLQEGDCYQVNFAQRFSVPVSGSPWSAYLKLRKTNPAPFAAYLNTPFGQLLSSSPERFLKLRNRQVETRPIKGTRARSENAVLDRAMVKQLQSSPKDKAENLMIVDLLRNDLGKCCRPGSIRVPQLFGVEHYATVHHLVSVIEGELAAGEDAISLLRHCFPGGSITGAPKLRAMEIIEELEPHRRGVYCGTIGYIGHNGSMDSNIAIRTAVYREGRLSFSAGGGIVRDSVCAEEYQETFDKAAGLLRILES